MDTAPEKTPTRPPIVPGDVAVAVGLLAVALWLRFWGLGSESFYIDEVVTLRSLDTGLWSHVRDVETSPPLYFVLVRWWGALAGKSHEGLRLLSALCGALAVPVLWGAARAAGMGRAAAATGAMLLAAAPLAIWHSQQARHYALLVLLAAVYTLALAVAVRRPGRGAVLAVAAAIVAGFSAHYYFAFLVAGAAPAVLALGLASRRHRGLMAAHVAGGLACTVYTPLFLHQAAANHTRYIPVPGWGDLWGVAAGAFIAGPGAAAPGWLAVAMGALLALAAAGLLVLACRETSGDGARGWFWPAALVGMAVVPVVVPWVVSVMGRPIFLRDRYTVVALPAFLLALALAAEALRPAGARRVALGVLALVLLPPMWIGGARQRRQLDDFDWRGAVAIVDGEWRPGDGIMALPGWLAATYQVNGGTRADFLAPTPPGAGAGRVWLMVWEQNPTPEEQAVAAQWRALPGARARLVWPHMALWEIPRN